MKKLLVIASFVFAGFSVQANDMSEYVEARMVPTSPTVIMVDTVIGSGENAFEVRAPWFAASFEITNSHSEDSLLIPQLIFNFKTVFDGITYESMSTLTADDLCQLVDDPIRSYYAQIAPGETFRGDADCDGVNRMAELVYISGLPLPTSQGADAFHRIYTVELDVQGYFLNHDKNEFITGNARHISQYTTH